MWWLFFIIHILLQYWRNVRLDGFSSNHHKISFQEQQNTQTQSAQIHYFFNGIWGSFENFCKTVNQPHEHATCIQTVSTWAFVHSFSTLLSLSFWVFTSCTLASFSFPPFAIAAHLLFNCILKQTISLEILHTHHQKYHVRLNINLKTLFTLLFFGVYGMGLCVAATARNSYAKKLDENNLLCFR